MKSVRLGNGELVFTVRRLITITPFDLRTVMARFLSRGVVPRNRRHFFVVALRMLERIGVDGMVRFSGRLTSFHPKATKELLRLVPEVLKDFPNELKDFPNEL